MINGLNTYIYANNNPISLTHEGACISGNVAGEMACYVDRGITTFVNGVARSKFSVRVPSIDTVALAVDLTASMTGALSVIRWTTKHPTFYEDLLTFGVRKHQMLFGLKSPTSIVSYLLLAYDVGADIWSHVRAGDSWQTTASSALVTAGVGALNIWAAGKVGAAIGGAIGGVPGFIVGTIAGVLVGVVINAVFYTKINGKTLAGYMEDEIKLRLEILF